MSRLFFDEFGIRKPDLSYWRNWMAAKLVEFRELLPKTDPGKLKGSGLLQEVESES
jgi:hypothetical protein